MITVQSLRVSMELWDGIFCMVVAAGMYRNKITIFMATDFLCLYGMENVGIAMLILTVGMAAGLCLSIKSVTEQEKELARKKKELCDMRGELLLSQISLHFIYNTLTTIKHLCKKDARLAAETVDEFSGYLRGNIDLLTGDRMISFSRELAHAKNFIAIEQKRFGKRINIVYDIREDAFLVPALTLQPIVENAVRHGITKREQGGTIRISSGKDNADYWIRVEDDGVGYQTDKTGEDRKHHVGISNVTGRVESMCGGTVTIESILGKGTDVLIRIPRKEEDKGENIETAGGLRYGNNDADIDCG